MKKRIINKHINRYIKPVIKDLPTTAYRTFEVEKDGKITIMGKNHTIINGDVVPEGQIIKRRGNHLDNIKLTGLKAQEIIKEYGEVYLRMVQYKGCQVRMRLITK